jgi:hypothetical protein
MAKTVLTLEQLDRVVMEELKKMVKHAAVEDVPEPDEVEAGDLADTLEKKVDLYKAMKVEETRLITRIKKIRENRMKIKQKIFDSLSLELKGIDHGTHAAWQN